MRVPLLSQDWEAIVASHLRAVGPSLSPTDLPLFYQMTEASVGSRGQAFLVFSGRPG